ncbi:MAG: SpoIIE family protein phosphatase, partial [Bacteroidota bacterium]
MGYHRLMCSIQIELGKVYYFRKRYTTALQNLTQGLATSRQFRLKEKTQQAAEYLAFTYQALGQYQAAYESHRLFKAMTDSLLNETKTQQLTEIQMRHQFEVELDSIAMEDTKRTSQLESQVARQRTLQVGTVIVLLLSVGFGLVVLRLYRSNRRANEQLLESNEEIQSNNEEIRSVNESLQHSVETVQKQWDEITSSILYAQRIQQAILPPEGILRTVLPEHFVLFRPRNVVSGDVYWISDRRHLNGKVFMAAVDCTGHGVPGAFMSLIANDLLNNLINERQLEDPGEILDQLHLEIRQSLNQDTTFSQDGMDIGLVAIDFGKKVLAYAGAKLPLVYVQDGNLYKRKGNSASIGGVRGELTPSYTTHEIFYAGGLTFYLYSDGYQDQFGGASGKKFMAPRFRNLLYQVHKLPLADQKKGLEETLYDWMEDEEQVDDIMVLGVRLS